VKWREDGGRRTEMGRKVRREEWEAGGYNRPAGEAESLRDAPIGCI